MGASPLDTSTSVPEAVARRMQKLEDRIADLESTRVSQITYFSGNPAEVAAKIASLASARNGSVIAILEDKGVEGVFTNFYVKFPSGWIKF